MQAANDAYVLVAAFHQLTNIPRKDPHWRTLITDSHSNDGSGSAREPTHALARILLAPLQNPTYLRARRGPEVGLI